MVHDFKVEIAFAHDFSVFADGFFRTFEIAVYEFIGNFSADTGGECDKSVVVLVKEFLVYSRFVIPAVAVCFGDKFAQTQVARFIFCQQHQVITAHVVNHGVAVKTGGRRDVRFTSDNRFDTLFFA